MYTSRGADVAATARPQAHRSRLELAIAPSAVRIARQWTADQLAPAGPGHGADLIDSAVLVVSELVTNAIAAAGRAETAARSATTTILSLGDLPSVAARPGGGLPVVGPASAVLPGAGLASAGLADAGRAGVAFTPARASVCLVIVWLDEALRIEVSDSSCVPLPPSCDRVSDDEHGRGLLVVAALAARWGWRPEACGKVVWCELACDTGPG